MSVSEQVKELRELADALHREKWYSAHDTVADAADTIEALSAKLENAYYVKRNGKDDVIVSIMYNKADNKYHFVNLSKNHICACGFETTEEAIADMEQRKNNGSICDFYLIERSAEDCGGWIPCKERLPDKKGDYWITYTYESYKHLRKCVGVSAFIDGKFTKCGINIIAWKPCDTPEPYHEP